MDMVCSVEEFMLVGRATSQRSWGFVQDLAGLMSTLLLVSTLVHRELPLCSRP